MQRRQLLQNPNSVTGLVLLGYALCYYLADLCLLHLT